MAEGIYYTQADYIARWGDAELIRLTDEESTGQPDAFAFDQAAADASADADAYLAARYTIPFAEPIPRVLKSVVGALVREKLHAQFPTETVTREADLARKTLADLATGKAKLLVATGEESPQPEGSATAGIAVVVGRPRVFTNEVLDKF